MAAQTEKRTVDIILNGQQPAKTLKELNGDIRIMTASLRQLDINSPEWNTQAAQLQKLRDQYKNVNDSVKATAFSMGGLKDQVKAIAIGTIGANLITGLTTSLAGYFSGVVDNLGKTADQLSGIRKTTGLTAAEIDKLDASFSKIETRTSKADLRGIAIIGGQLNVPTDQLLGFTEAIDKVTVALGDEFTGGAEQVTASLGKLRNILTDLKSDDYGNDILNIGNALNELGNAGLATGPVVTDIATRIGSVGRQSGLTSGQIFGIAAAIQELGINSERGSTAVIRLLSKMKENTVAFASVAGVELKEFERLLNEDIFTALLKVAEGTQSASGKNTEFVKVLAQLETEGAGVQELLAGFSNNLELVKEKADISSAAIEGTGSILNEFGIYNENAAGKLAKLSKEFAKFKDSKFVRDSVESAVDALLRFVEFIKNAGPILSKFSFLIKGLAAIFSIYTLSLLKNIAAKQVSLALDKTTSVIATVVATSVKALIFVTDMLTSATERQIVKQRIFNAVAKVNPYIALASGVALLIIGIKEYINKQEIALANQRKLNKEKADELVGKSAESTSDSFQKRINSAKNYEEAVKIEQEAIAIDKRNRDQISKLKSQRDKLIDDSKNIERPNILPTTAGYSTIMSQYAAEKTAINNQLQLIQEDIQRYEKAEQTFRPIVKKAADKAAEIKKQSNQTQKTLSSEEIKAQQQSQEEYLANLRDYNKKLEDLRRQSARAGISVIEDEMQRELEALKLTRDEKIADSKASEKELIDQAKKLGQSTAEVEKNAANVRLGINAEYLRDKKALEEKYAKEITDTEYQQEIDNLAKAQARKLLLLDKEYLKGNISKQQYEDAQAAIEVNGKQTLIDILKDYGKDATEAERQYAAAIIAILENKSEATTELARAETDLRLAQLELLVRKAQQKTESTRNKGTGYKDALEAERQAQEAYLQAQLESELAATDLLEAEKLAIKAKYLQMFSELEASYDLADTERKISIAQYALSQIQAFGDALFSARMEKIQVEKQAMEDRYSTELEQLQNLKDQGILSEVDFNKRKAVLDEQAAKKRLQIKRKEAEAERRSALFSIAIQTAANIVQAFPNVIAMIAAGALGALQAGFVASKPLPSFGKGGDGIVKGPSHNSKSKGLWVVNPVTGGVEALIEGDEAILSRKTVENNRPIVDALLNSSMNMGGRSISSVPAYQKPLASQSVGSWTSAIRTTTLARGGFIDGRNATQTNTSQPNNQFQTIDPEIKALLKMNYDLMDDLKRNGVSGIWEYDKFKQGIKKYEDVNKRGNVGS